MKSPFEAQLSSIIDDYEAMRKASKYSDLSDLPEDERQSLTTRSVAAVHRISGTTSTYSQEIARIIEMNPALHERYCQVKQNQADRPPR